MREQENDALCNKPIRFSGRATAAKPRQGI